MSLGRLKLLGFLLPVVFLVVLEIVRSFFLESLMPHFWVRVTFVLVVVAGAFIFTGAMFGLLDRMRRRIVSQNQELAAVNAQATRRSQQLAALNEATLAMTAELTLETVLQKVVDLSRSLVKARYGALGVFEEGKQLAHFITSGLEKQDKAQIGKPPTGKGLLGLVLEEARPIRVADISQHPRSVGFPPSHPVMKTFMGVPIIYKGTVIGNLYLTEKEGGQQFSQEDEEVMNMFAAQAAIAIENARLYQQVQRLAVLEERERIGQDLHDGIIQSIYAIGLSLEHSADLMENSPQEVKERLEYAVDSLNDVIREIRNYIFHLRPLRVQGRGLVEGLEELAREYEVNALLKPTLALQVDGDVPLSPEQVENLLHIAREALTNAAKHAKASTVKVQLYSADGKLGLVVEDDGQGFDPEAPRSTERQGLRNMEQRAIHLSGYMEIQSSPGQGTRLVVEIPLKEEARP